MTNIIKELNDFQKNVYNDYEGIKSIKRTSERVKDAFENGKKGCLYLPIAIFTNFAVKKGVHHERRKRNYNGVEREVGELLRQQEIAGKICEVISVINRTDILTEEKFVYEFTASIFKTKLADRFIIPEQSFLYAMMANEIFNIGLEKFCDDKKGDI